MATNPFYVALGKQIREGRKQAGLTQGELAEKVRLSRTSITNIELGFQPLQVHTLVEVAHALGCSASGLVDAVEHRPQSPDASVSELEGVDNRTKNWMRRVMMADASVARR